MRILQEDLQTALQQTDELKARSSELEAKLLLTGAGKIETVSAKQKFTKRMLVSDSMLRNVGAVHAGLMVECFPGIKTVELHRVIDERDLGSPETVIIHVCT